MRRLLATLLLALALASTTACFDPAQPPCAFSCEAPGAACPDDYTCGDDGLCHHDGDQGMCALDPAARDAGNDP